MTKPIQFKFTGLMAPVFTPFKNDKQRSINYELIPLYAKYLKKKNVPGVLINGTSGEGTSLSIIERQKTTETWKVACKKYDLTLMVQIGGAAFVDVIEMAKHAEKQKVDAILCLPELYFKPKSEQELVNYLKNIAEHCPNTPLLYYHIPKLTGVNIYMPSFLELAEQSIPNFVGLKFTSNDLDEGAACLKPGRSVFLGADKILASAILLGFDSAIMTSLSICPELAIKIFDHMKNNKLKDAQVAQSQLNSRVNDILKRGEWVNAMKYEFNLFAADISMGPPRFPLEEIVEIAI